MEKLATLLGRERLLLELLTFKLVELRQLLAAGETRFLDWASEEVERAVTGLRGVELERAVLLADATAEHGLADGASLRELVEQAREPWRTILAEHRESMASHAVEVEQELGACRHLARSGVGAVAETLDRIAAGTRTREPQLATYGPSATWTHSAPAPRVEQTL